MTPATPNGVTIRCAHCRGNGCIVCKQTGEIDPFSEAGTFVDGTAYITIDVDPDKRLVLDVQAADKPGRRYWLTEQQAREVCAALTRHFDQLDTRAA